MAIKSSGQLSLRDDIRAEFGTSTTNISLRNLSSIAGFSTPDAMSEFYGYSQSEPSRIYWRGDGVNDTIRNQGFSVGLATDSPLTWSGWYRIDSNGTAVEQLGSLSESGPNGNNQFFLQYDGRFNRIYWRYRYNRDFAQRQYPLHDNPNRGITGITNATPGWSAGQRGNTNADGFVHLTFTWNPTDTTSNALQVYWNGQRLTYSVNNRNGQRRGWAIGSMAIGDLVSTGGNNPNVFQGGIDHIAIWRKVLTQAEITSVYNGGQPATMASLGVTDRLIAEYRLEGDATNTNPSGVSGGNIWPNLNNNNGGQFINY